MENGVKLAVIPKWLIPLLNPLNKLRVYTLITSRLSDYKSIVIV